MTKAKTTEMTEKQNTAMAAIEADMEADSGSGFEEADSDSYAIPFLMLLQSNSPQCKKSEGKYIPGAEEGHILNSVSQEVFKDGIVVVPCHHQRVYTVWDGDSDKFKGELQVSDPLIPQAKIHEESTGGAKKKKVLRLPNGDKIVDTRKFYVLRIREDGTYEPGLIAMKSTQIKVAKNWMFFMRNLQLPRSNGEGTFNPPMFSHTYKLSSRPESGDGQSWMGWSWEKGEKVTDPDLYRAAKALHDAVRSGSVKEAQPVDEGEKAEEEKEVNW